MGRHGPEHMTEEALAKCTKAAVAGNKATEGKASI